MYLKILIYIIFQSVFTMSCGSDIGDITPALKNGNEHLTKEISSEISFTQLVIRSTKSESTGERTSRNLDIVLTDASIKLFARKNLDSLTNRIASIVKENVTNIYNYDWVNIMYETTDGSQASDSTDKNVYVFRPNEIK